MVPNRVSSSGYERTVKCCFEPEESRIEIQHQ